MPQHTPKFAGTALLPTQTRMNPVTPSLAEYWDPDQVLLVVQDVDKPKRQVVLTTAGSEAGHKLGDLIVAQHDQRCSWIGDFKVIGIRVGNTARCYGELPDRKLPHWVFK